MLATPVLTGSAQAATPKYTVKIINSAVGVKLFGINSNGDVFGTAVESGAQTSESFLLKAGSTTPQFLGTPGDQANKVSSSVALGISASDNVVGYTLSDQAGNTEDVPVEWANSVTPTILTGLNTLAPHGAQATGINDGGEIIGTQRNPAGNGDVSFKIQGSTMTTLPALPNGGVDAHVFGISNNGFIVGDGDTAQVGPRSVEWNSSGAITALPQLASTFESQAFAVNSSGVAVGDAVLTTDNRAHAVMWANGKATELSPGTLIGFNSVANSVNDSGVIVGGGDADHGFVYQNGTMTDLNTLIAPTAGLTLFAATGINSKGVIAGSATLNGQDVGYILTPVS